MGTADLGFFQIHGSHVCCEHVTARQAAGSGLDMTYLPLNPLNPLTDLKLLACLNGPEGCLV
jgi:hypothetical protein